MFSFLKNIFCKKEIVQDIVKDEVVLDIEEPLSFQERLIKRWAYKTIDSKIKNCTYRTEERGGLVFEYWTDSFGNDLKMLRSDGSGYIQVCNSRGEVFGSVTIDPGYDDMVCWVRTSEPFDVTMRWFMAH